MLRILQLFIVPYIFYVETHLYLGQNCTEYDQFYDRVLSLTYKKEVITLGVLLDDARVLTSYNPYRNLTHRPNMKYKVRVNITLSRMYDTNDNTYVFHDRGIACARQVVPMKDSDIPNNQWHGANRNHTPLHDLMVLRLAKTVTLIEEEPVPYELPGHYKTYIGPRSVRLASSRTRLQGNLSIASFGFEDGGPEWIPHHVCSVEYDPDMIVDCDEWFPRDWGLLICLSNKDNFGALNSGALLTNNGTLFGVGSFLMKKGKQSIMVFTDVRPYRKMIMKACTDTDQIY